MAKKLPLKISKSHAKKMPKAKTTSFIYGLPAVFLLLAMAFLGFGAFRVLTQHANLRGSISEVEQPLKLEEKTYKDVTFHGLRLINMSDHDSLNYKTSNFEIKRDSANGYGVDCSKAGKVLSDIGKVESLTLKQCAYEFEGDYVGTKTLDFHLAGESKDTYATILSTDKLIPSTASATEGYHWVISHIVKSSDFDSVIASRRINGGEFYTALCSDPPFQARNCTADYIAYFRPSWSKDLYLVELKSPSAIEYQANHIGG